MLKLIAVVSVSILVFLVVRSQFVRTEATVAIDDGREVAIPDHWLNFAARRNSGFERITRDSRHARPCEKGWHLTNMLLDVTRKKSGPLRRGGQLLAGNYDVQIDLPSDAIICDLGANNDLVLGTPSANIAYHKFRQEFVGKGYDCAFRQGWRCIYTKKVNLSNLAESEPAYVSSGKVGFGVCGQWNFVGPVIVLEGRWVNNKLRWNYWSQNSDGAEAVGFGHIGDSPLAVTYYQC